MAYPPVVAAALSGASTSQLAYWRSARTPEPLLAPAHHKPGSRVSYSYRDVVALRTFSYLRTYGVPLHQIRDAVAGLQKVVSDEHLHMYSLVAQGRRIAWRLSAEKAIDPIDTSDRAALAHLSDILAPFVNLQGRRVVDLRRPVPGVSIDPGIRGGFPVIEGTRITYDLVASLYDDSPDVEAITDLYPSVTADAARGAAEFARYVDTFERPGLAA